MAKTLSRGLLFIGLLACHRPTPMNGEFASILPEIVLGFDYETSEFRLSAHRFAQGVPFRIVVETRDNAIRSCMSDEGFERLLLEFESLKIRRHMSEQALAKVKPGLKYHRLRYYAAPPMQTFEEQLLLLPNGSLLAEFEDFGYELQLSTRAVDQLRDSCR